MSQIDNIISVAERYIGIKESPPNSNNVIFNTRYYGKAVNGSAYPWCCAFIWCLFQDIGAPELFYGGKKTASCTELMNYAKSNGLFHTSGFKRGDLALFDFDKDPRKSEHIGIITGVTVSGVQTIEGNTSVGNDSDGGEVMRRTRSNGLIIGVYRPKYKEDDEVIDKTQMMFNGKKVEVERIFKNDTNYVKLRDLEKFGLTVSYDAVAKLPVISK